MNLTDEQSQACQELLDALKLETHNSRLETCDSEQEALYVDDPFTNSTSDFDCDNSENIIYEYGHSSADDDTSISPDLLPPITSNAVQEHILALLCSLYAHLPSPDDGLFCSPLIRFIILKSLKADGQWLPPRVITHIIAILLFCGRQVMMAMMRGEMSKDSGIRFSRYDLRLFGSFCY